eukprot:COSAG01_NODE_27244_length_690_cov_2.318105_2_plen_73_part_00
MRDLDYAGGGGEEGASGAGGANAKFKAGWVYRHDAIGKSWKGKKRWCEVSVVSQTAALLMRRARHLPATAPQ